jgi:hypothetical protein
MSEALNRNEAAPYYFKYIDRVSTDNIIDFLKSQMKEFLVLLKKISEQKSLFRYEPNKWTIREVLNHINDIERVFLYRGLWFARGFDSQLPDCNQDTAVDNSGAVDCPWANHIREFTTVRMATLSFLRNLPATAWSREGIAGGNKFTVRAIAYIIAGHVSHHIAILKERYGI